MNPNSFTNNLNSKLSYCGPLSDITFLRIPCLVNIDFMCNIIAGKFSILQFGNLKTTLSSHLQSRYINCHSNGISLSLLSSRLKSGTISYNHWLFCMGFSVFQARCASANHFIYLGLHSWPKHHISGPLFAQFLA